MFAGQVRTFYTSVLNEEQRKRLCENIAGHLKDAQLFIQRKVVSETWQLKGGLCWLEKRLQLRENP